MYTHPSDYDLLKAYPSRKIRELLSPTNISASQSLPTYRTRRSPHSRSRVLTSQRELSLAPRTRHPTPQLDTLYSPIESDSNKVEFSNSPWLISSLRQSLNSHTQVDSQIHQTSRRDVLYKTHHLLRPLSPFSETRSDSDDLNFSDSVASLSLRRPQNSQFRPKHDQPLPNRKSFQFRASLPQVKSAQTDFYHAKPTVTAAHK